MTTEKSITKYEVYPMKCMHIKKLNKMPSKTKSSTKNYHQPINISHF